MIPGEWCSDGAVGGGEGGAGGGSGGGSAGANSMYEVCLCKMEPLEASPKVADMCLYVNSTHIQMCLYTHSTRIYIFS